MNISAVFATDSAGGLGHKGAIPWPRLSADLKNFRQLTLGQLVILGSATWNSTDMPQPLPGRVNLVLSSQQLHMPSGHWCCSGTVAEVCEFIQGQPQLQHLHCWVIGGAQVLQQWLPWCHTVWHTSVQGQWPADCWLPAHHWQSDFQLLDRQSHEQQHITYDICQYQRVF